MHTFSQECQFFKSSIGYKFRRSMLMWMHTHTPTYPSTPTQISQQYFLLILQCYYFTYPASHCAVLLLSKVFLKTTKYLASRCISSHTHCFLLTFFSSLWNGIQLLLICPVSFAKDLRNSGEGPTGLSRDSSCVLPAITLGKAQNR